MSWIYSYLPVCGPEVHTRACQVALPEVSVELPLEISALGQSDLEEVVFVPSCAGYGLRPESGHARDGIDAAVFWLPWLNVSAKPGRPLGQPRRQICSRRRPWRPEYRRWGSTFLKGWGRSCRDMRAIYSEIEVVVSAFFLVGPGLLQVGPFLGTMAKDFFPRFQTSGGEVKDGLLGRVIDVGVIL